jgi:transcriptional regulator with PAS, ATPase and Fis domain
MAQKNMRRDFYYRINVISIELIPLRERLEDIPAAGTNFLHRHPWRALRGPPS